MLDRIYIGSSITRVITSVMWNSLSYESMDPGSFPIFPTYIGMTIFCIVMTTMLFRRWRERLTRPPKLLFFTFASYSACIVILTVGFAQVIITNYKMELYQFSLAFGFAGIMASNSFLILFAVDLYSLNAKRGWVYVVIDLVIAAILALPANNYGVATKDIQGFKLRPFSFGAMLIFSAIIYLRICFLSFRTGRKITERLGKTGFMFIGLSQICMILFLGFMGMDLLAIALSPATGYTPFNFLAWAMGALFFLFAYLGLIMPGWLKRHLEASGSRVQ